MMQWTLLVTRYVDGLVEEGVHVVEWLGILWRREWATFEQYALWFGQITVVYIYLGVLYFVPVTKALPATSVKW